MSIPTTTLQDIITLAHQQYGIRFQVSRDQLIRFVNIIQTTAYNKDLDAFLEKDQIFFLGHDVFLETDSGSYTAPTSTDIGLSVSGSTSGVVGTLLNYKTKNRINQWIISPPDGYSSFSLTPGETLTIVGGSAATGVVAEGQDFKVSKGPYPVPKETTSGVHPVRKFVGVSSITDAQRFKIPSSSSTDDDYGLQINPSPSSRSSNFPFKYDIENQEVTLVTSSELVITQSAIPYGPAGTTINTSDLRWIYYKGAPQITSISDDDKLVLPERYRYEIIYLGIARLADIATYGDNASYREIIEPLCERFWEDMSTDFQAFGDASDWISDPQGWMK